MDYPKLYAEKNDTKRTVPTVSLLVPFYYGYAENSQR